MGAFLVLAFMGDGASKCKRSQGCLKIVLIQTTVSKSLAREGRKERGVHEIELEGEEGFFYFSVRRERGVCVCARARARARVRVRMHSEKEPAGGKRCGGSGND